MKDEALKYADRAATAAMVAFVMALIGLGIACYNCITLSRENAALKHQLEQAKADAGKPVHLTSLPSQSYRLNHAKNYALVKSGDDVFAVYTYDFRINLPEEFLLMGGHVCDAKTAKQIRTDNE
jgi:hypothetical protein